ncbi:hypothetical protein [Nannocystis exedens]|uniref:hypothetical protein n=1 Tax=Nannocystis exedens TaxID=54 RepID=UPI000BC9DD56|nr:hypothetical protein [Nannocystis exedens]PCC70872.1 hypothetical protein NAEX_03936 [Nannocystis exedens]
MTSNEHEPLGGRDGKSPTLGQAARAFFTFHSPRIFAVVWPLLVATRLAVGDFGWASSSSRSSWRPSHSSSG